MNTSQTELKKVSLESMDVGTENRAKLKALFPSVFTETLNEKEKLVESIDFEKLKAELGTFSDLFEGRKERYGMDWPGKRECLKIIQQPSLATLKPCREESVNFDTTENLFIEGDNLEVLKLLQKSYYSKVKMIYIDPPYNTGKEFIYPDNYSESIDTYLVYAGLIDAEGKKFSTNTSNEGRFHTKWLNMMYPRLHLARNLLGEDGAILVSIGDDELSNLIVLMNEIFGEENQIGIFTWKSRAKPTNAGDARYRPQKVAEYVVAYGRQPGNEIKLNVVASKKRTYPHEDSNGKYRTTTILTSNRGMFRRETMRFESGGYKPDEDNRWKAGKEVINHLFTHHKIIFNEDGIPLEKKYEHEECDPLYPIYCFMEPELTGTAETGKADLNEVLGNQHGLDTVKPVQLIKYFIETFSKKNDIILDFFSGSCTTANAVLDLNEQDCGTRKFIMIQLPEPCQKESGSFKTIAEIGKQRIYKVIQNIKKNNADQQNLGFKVLKLNKSNFKVWEQAPQTSVNQLTFLLEDHILHIDPKASQEDILYELLLKSGYLPTAKIEKQQMAGKTVYSIGDGVLMICLESEITREFIEAVAATDPERFICLDHAFKGNDQLKANAMHAFSSRRSRGNQDVFRTI